MWLFWTLYLFVWDQFFTGLCILGHSVVQAGSTCLSSVHCFATDVRVRVQLWLKVNHSPSVRALARRGSQISTTLQVLDLSFPVVYQFQDISPSSSRMHLVTSGPERTHYARPQTRSHLFPPCLLPPPHCSVPLHHRVRLVCVWGTPVAEPATCGGWGACAQIQWLSAASGALLTASPPRDFPPTLCPPCFLPGLQPVRTQTTIVQ